MSETNWRMPPAGMDEECRNRHGALVDQINDLLIPHQDHAYARGMAAMKAACIAKVFEVTKDWHVVGDETKASAGIYLQVQLKDIK